MGKASYSGLEQRDTSHQPNYHYHPLHSPTTHAHGTIRRLRGGAGTGASSFRTGHRGSRASGGSGGGAARGGGRGWSADGGGGLTIDLGLNSRVESTGHTVHAKGRR